MQRGCLCAHRQTPDNLSFAIIDRMEIYKTYNITLINLISFFPVVELLYNRSHFC